MRGVAYYWGIVGVIMIMVSAIMRLTPRVLELQGLAMSPLQWGVLLLFVPLMIYSEGYKGFHLNFSPRVIVRAQHLRRDAPLLPLLLAPLFCMGYFHATRKRKIVSWAVTSTIILLIVVVSHMAQPWRGVIDAGVVTGLVAGTASLFWFWLRLEFADSLPAMPADLPPGRDGKDGRDG